jgi:serine/threonine protein kinase
MSYDQWELVNPADKSNASAGAFGTVRKVRRASAAAPDSYQLGALKELKNLATPGVIGLAKNEIAKIATVDHPNIARFIEDGLNDGLPWFVMGFVEGTSLEKLVKQGKKLSESKWKDFIIEVLDALAYLETKSLSHLDLHPGNVILTKSGHFTIVDFGLSASVYGKKLNIQHWGYAAPEQFSGLIDAPESPASDVFAFAQTAYLVATGSSVWKSENRDEKIWNLVNRPPNLDRLAPKYRQWLQPALARDPKNRPTARELLQSFREIDSMSSEAHSASESIKTWADVEGFLNKKYLESVDFAVAFRFSSGAAWQFELDQDSEPAILRMEQVGTNRIPTTSNVKTRLDRLGWRAASPSSAEKVLKLDHADDTSNVICMTLHLGFGLEVENLSLISK